jgi:tetratricopeptide (TPR) repeat protein
MQRMSAYRREVCIGLLLVVLIGVAFGRVLGRDFEFVSFDDYEYVKENPQVHAGLTGTSLGWALTTSWAYNWHPLTWVSLQLDYELYGLDPRGYHLTNLLLHSANAVLLFWVLRRMTGAVWRSAIVAAFFAVHPLHVESVAWIAERKDVLSTFFWMLTLWAYVSYAERPGVGRYVLVFLALVLGLMSKPMLVTLPCVLLLLDYWPLGRVRWEVRDPPDSAEGTGSGLCKPRFAPASVGWLLTEKLPLFALVIVSSGLTIRAQRELVATAESFSLRTRVLNALVSYVTYMGQMFWPANLAALYPHPRDSLPVGYAASAGALLLVITLAVLLLVRRRPYLAVGWLWYLGTLVPVIGLVQTAVQARADRYTYVPLIGLFVMLTWGAADLLARGRFHRVVLAGAAALLLAACTAATWIQLQYWKNSFVLVERAKQVTPHNTHLYYVSAMTYWRHHRLAEATEELLAQLELQPNNPASERDVGHLFLEQGRIDEAAAHLARVVELRPDAAPARVELAHLLRLQGKSRAAAEQLAVAVRLEPQAPEWQYELGIALQGQGELTEAVRCLRVAVGLDPNRVKYRCALACALQEQGDPLTAQKEYQRASQVDPHWPGEFDRRAWRLATHPDVRLRDAVEALALAKQVCQATRYQQPVPLDTLAAAYAEAGHFPEAVATAERAQTLAAAAKREDLAKELAERVRLYKECRPYREQLNQGSR